MKGALKTMYVAELKRVVGVVMVVAALGASGLAYRASGQPTPGAIERPTAQTPPTVEKRKPMSEVEALRRENELLKLNLEVVLEKVRAQEAELRTYRAAKGETRKQQDEKSYLNEAKRLLELERKAQPKSGKNQGQDLERLSDQLKRLQSDKKNGLELERLSEQMKRLHGSSLQELKDLDKRINKEVLQQLEAAVKSLRKARDEETQREAREALDEALRELQKEIEKLQSPSPPRR
jgi:hypothetical protein